MEFEFLDISDSTAPAYLHHFVFTIDADHHTAHWTFMLTGGKSLRAHFDLTRAKASGPAAAGK